MTSNNSGEPQDDFYDECKNLLETIKKSLEEDIQNFNEIKPLIEKQPDIVKSFFSNLFKKTQSLDDTIGEIEKAKTSVNDLIKNLSQEADDEGKAIVDDFTNKMDELNRKSE